MAVSAVYKKREAAVEKANPAKAKAAKAKQRHKQQERQRRREQHQQRQKRKESGLSYAAAASRSALKSSHNNPPKSANAEGRDGSSSDPFAKNFHAAPVSKVAKSGGLVGRELQTFDFGGN